MAGSAPAVAFADVRPAALSGDEGPGESQGRQTVRDPPGAHGRPEALAQHVQNSRHTPGLRARAAEAAGDIPDTSVAVSLLLPLLDDAEPIVREAAIYGLQRHLVDEVRERLRRLVEAPDTTEGVRMAALEAIEDD